jgi:protocatechuate 3,4-dioxygenase alpha subunit
VTLPTTPSQTVGPFYAIGLCRRPENELADPSDPASLRVTGQLLDGDGRPVEDGMIEVWDPVWRRWGRSGTDARGGFSFVLAKPPSDGAQAPRLEVYVFARGLLRHQRTRLYFPDEVDANAGDPLLAALDDERRGTLVADAQDGALRFDIHLQGGQETVFFEQ